MSLLFVGDIACPNHIDFKFDELSSLFEKKTVVANIEGPVFEEEIPDPLNLTKYNLYNNTGFLKINALSSGLICNLANNHMDDFGIKGMKSTLMLLKREKIPYFGAKDIPFVALQSENVEYLLIGFCTYNTDPGKMINTFDPGKALNTVKKLYERFPESRIIVNMHWGIELLKLPLPADREWAHSAIDNGVFAVIGHHPHITQGVEIYKDRLIAYSLGNFVLPQTSFCGKKLHYKSPDVKYQLALEIEEDNWKAYSLIYEDNKVRTIDKKDVNMKIVPEFNSFNSIEYLQYFKQQTQYYKGLFELFFPTYQSYRKYAGYNNVVLKRKMKMYQIIRKILIKSAVHKPNFLA